MLRKNLEDTKSKERKEKMELEDKKIIWGGRTIYEYHCGSTSESRDLSGIKSKARNREM